MSEDFATAWEPALRRFVERLIAFETTAGNELPAQEWIAERLTDFGFKVYEWTADAETLASHPSFPDDPDEIQVADRPSVAGVLEFGDPDDGPTLVLNGHVDVVPAERALWDADPFEPTWDGDRLIGRGACDMKAGIGTCVFAARHLAEYAARPSAGIDGRIVVESVVGEEEGGIGAASAALSNPYPFDRDAAVGAEPTDLRPVVATEGSLMKRLRLTGRSAHAASRWHGESVLPHFERIRAAFRELETDRGDRVTHPLYEEFPVPWPVVVGTVEAGSWASTVPAELESEWRIGVAPGETVDDVEAEFDARLDDLVADDEWLSANPPTFERFSIQFEPAETDPDEPVVKMLQAAMGDNGMASREPAGATYGADSRHYVAAGIPTVLFGAGDIQQAHYPNESIEWSDVCRAGETLADAARRFLASG